MGDFGDFKSEAQRGDTDAEPPDGVHTATLVRAVIRESRNTGDKGVVTEWQTLDMAYYWSNWGGTTGGAATHTLRLLRGIGLDPDKFEDWDDVGEELAHIEGNVYEVKVQRNGDYLNTYVTGKPDHVQTEIPVVAPEPAGGGRSAIFDDDVPF